MPSQHKHPPIPFRPPEGDRAWLLEHAKAIGQPINRILAEALAEYRKNHVGMIAHRLAAQRRLLTDPHAAAAMEVRRRGGTWADVESFLNMAPGTAQRAYAALVEAATGEPA